MRTFDGTALGAPDGITLGVSDGAVLGESDFKTVCNPDGTTEGESE